MSDQDKLAELQDNRAEPVIFSDFHSAGVSGPSRSIGKPWDIIYFLKGMTNIPHPTLALAKPRHLQHRPKALGAW